ncbi:MAG: SusD/RagB family nutrient-binding outer membrane lipoprotein [Gemmatimonadaceae bacterium]
MHFSRFAGAILSVAAFTAMTGCETDLTGLNVNPNNPTTAPAGPLFTSAVANEVGRFAGNSLSGTSLFAQHIAQVQYVDEDRGHLRPGTMDAFFGAYANELEDLEKVALLGLDTKSPNVTGPARVMQVWGFQNMTDVYGDIPYSEALKGDIQGSPTKPKYDAQKDIYAALLKTLADASATMKVGGDAGLGSADAIYKGDVAKWQKLSNSLRARLAMRMSKADPAKASAELTAAFAAAGGIMTSNADIAGLTWPGDGVFDNPWAVNFAGRDDHRVSKTLLDTMNVLADPRVRFYAQPTKADPTKYVGLQNGLDNVTVTPFFNTTSRPGAMFYPGTTVYGTFGSAAGKKTPSYIMTYAEVAFIQAEAANRGLGGLASAQAAGFYAAGVTASIMQWGGTAADAAAYLAQPSIAYAGGATGLKQIGLQKWISLFTQGTEAWSEWRRTGNPASIKMGPKAYADTPEVPRRFLYPAAESAVNSASLLAAIAAQGPNSLYTRVWWDK